MTTPTNPPANVPQRISAENQPQFPCWLWLADYRYPSWTRCLSMPEYSLEMMMMRYTHWHPDQPTAPTVQPEQEDNYAVLKEYGLPDAPQPAPATATPLDSSPDSLLSASDDRITQLETELQAAQAEVASLREYGLVAQRREGELAQAHAETLAKLEEANAWKQSALAVEASWDCQSVARWLQLPLGSDIRKSIEPAVVALINKLTAAEQQVAELQSELEDLHNEMRVQNDLNDMKD